MKTTRFLLAATIVLAMALTLTGCAEDPVNNPGDGSGDSCGKLMSQNLNVYVAGSVCYGNDPANCSKYGRLYNWATAMNLPAKCNTTLSTDDPECAIQNNHRGICPSGQHIPSIEELKEYGSYEECMKNQFGGNGRPDGRFYDVRHYGSWWSSSERNSDTAYSRHVYYDVDGAPWGNDGKGHLFSVRCLQD
jgi:hypothetical protein